MLKALFCSLITCLPVSHSHAGDFENYEELQALIVSLEKEAIYPHGELAGIFAEVRRQNKALEAMMRPAESTKEWKDYRSQFLSNERVNKGLDFWDKHQDSLNKAEAQYGVPPEIILAIIGVETKYGGNKGSFRG